MFAIIVCVIFINNFWYQVCQYIAYRYDFRFQDIFDLIFNDLACCLKPEMGPDQIVACFDSKQQLFLMERKQAKIHIEIIFSARKAELFSVRGYFHQKGKTTEIGGIDINLLFNNFCYL